MKIRLQIYFFELIDFLNEQLRNNNISPITNCKQMIIIYYAKNTEAKLVEMNIISYLDIPRNEKSKKLEMWAIDFPLYDMLTI